MDQYHVNYHFMQLINGRWPLGVPSILKLVNI